MEQTTEAKARMENCRDVRSGKLRSWTRVQPRVEPHSWRAAICCVKALAKISRYTVYSMYHMKSHAQLFVLMGHAIGSVDCSLGMLPDDLSSASVYMHTEFLAYFVS